MGESKQSRANTRDRFCTSVDGGTGRFKVYRSSSQRSASRRPYPRASQINGPRRRPAVKPHRGQCPSNIGVITAVDVNIFERVRSRVRWRRIACPSLRLRALTAARMCRTIAPSMNKDVGRGAPRADQCSLRACPLRALPTNRVQRIALGNDANTEHSAGPFGRKLDDVIARG